MTILTHLLPEDVELATAWGERLFQRARTGGFQSYGSDPAKRRRWHIVGACCEVAFARCFGLPWAPGINDFRGPDVGGWGVRGSDVPTRGLIIRNRDADDMPFALVIYEGKGWFRIHGWMLAREAKRAKWKATLDPRRAPEFMVPQGEVHPFESYTLLAKEERHAEDPRAPGPGPAPGAAG